jgi:RNA polymerase sigma factor (sigma-70 family)
MKAIAAVLPLLGVVEPSSGAVPVARPVAEPWRARPAAAGVPADEASLCAAALRGDGEAWSALVARHNHRVVVALLARGLRVDRAKDVAQEAWMRLVEQQRQGRLERLQLPGLAITQATFLALESARREANVRRHDPIDEPAIAAALADPNADAEARLVTEERVERAVEVLATCSGSAKKVFRLAYGGDGLSHAEVAERVGLSLQRVRQILCEVRAKLREALDEGEAR